MRNKLKGVKKERDSETSDFSCSEMGDSDDESGDDGPKPIFFGDKYHFKTMEEKSRHIEDLRTIKQDGEEYYLITHEDLV